MPIVTAADHRYARALRQMLASAERHGVHAAHPFVIVDIGLDAADRATVERAFPWCQIEPFDFDAYPPHVRNISNYAWKPCSVWTMVQRGEGPVIWLDSATLFRGSLDPLVEAIERDGLFSLAGQSRLEEICDPRTLARLDATPEDRRQPYRASGVLGFDPGRPAIRELARQWRDCALDEACIAPPGWTLRTHKPDQATITALIYRARREAGLHVGDDEVDISSTSPVWWLSTRNKVANWVPMSADPLVRAFYGVWKKADRVVLRIKRDGVARGLGESAERGLQRTLKRAAARRMAAVPVREKAAFRGRACHCDPRLPEHFVHSEALREASDLVVDEDSNIEHPQRRQVPVRALQAIADQVAGGDVIHVKSDLLGNFVRHVLPGIRHPFVLVTGDSDLSPVAAHATLLDDERVLHWFAQNCDVEAGHARLTRVPIGLDNPVYTKTEKRLGFAAGMAMGRIPFDASFSRNGMGDQMLLQRVRAQLRRRVEDKPPHVLCTFHRNSVLAANANAIPDRREAIDVLGRSPDCHFIERRLRQEEYWLAHDGFAFELSPRGNGLDCFRTWECLLLRTIPIVKRSPLDALYRQERFPVVVVESFREVTAENLRRWQRELADRFDDGLQRSLTADYWIAKITARRRAASCQPVCSR